MNEELILDKMDRNEKNIESNSKAIAELRFDIRAVDIQVAALCEKLESQTNSLTWLVRMLATTLLGFFIYAIQHNIFKK